MTYRGRMGRWNGVSRGRDIYIYEGFPGVSAVKKSPTTQKTQETRVQSLGQEDPLEKGMATPSSILTWRILMDRGAWRGPWGRKESDTTE